MGRSAVKDTDAAKITRDSMMTYIHFINRKVQADADINGPDASWI